MKPPTNASASRCPSVTSRAALDRRIAADVPAVRRRARRRTRRSAGRASTTQAARRRCKYFACTGFAATCSGEIRLAIQATTARKSGGRAETAARHDVGREQHQPEQQCRRRRDSSRAWHRSRAIASRSRCSVPPVNVCAICDHPPSGAALCSPASRAKQRHLLPLRTIPVRRDANVTWVTQQPKAAAESAPV